MDGGEGRLRIVDNGGSAELVAAFRCVAEVTAPDGGLKYSSRVSAALARRIAGRNYARTVVQLCHLVNVADACGRGADRYERFFFADGRASPAAFRARIDACVAAGGWRRPGFTRLANGVAIRYRERTVTVSFARMPMLAQMLEFLIATQSYVAIDDLLRDMLADPARDSSVRRAANAIGRQLYRYLSDHLPSVQAHGKFRRLMTYLNGRAANGTITIDDDAVLDFWQRQSRPGGGSGDFRMFRTVFRDFINVMRALELAESGRALESAVPLGQDRAAGEVDPPLTAGLGDAIGEWRPPLGALSEGPADGIDFLTGREMRRLSLLVECGPLSARLPLSLMRAETFGKGQSRIVQALRRQRAEGSLSVLFDCVGTESYREREGVYRDLLERIERAVRAAAYVVLRSGDGRAPDGAIALRRADPAALFEAARRDGIAIDRDRLDEALADARRAWEGIDRTGFEAGRLDDPDVIDGFRAGAGALIAIAGQIEAYLGRLRGIDRGDRGLDRRFADDRTIFSEQFIRIYGRYLHGDAVRDAAAGPAGPGRTAVRRDDRLGRADGDR